MERLTKKNPETNLERLLNFAIAEDKQVVLDYGFEKKPMVQVVAEKAKSMNCDVTEQAVMYEGQCMQCDCAVALMNMLGIQAAELHARLSLIEDILGDDYDLDRLATIMNQRMSMREDVAERWKLTSDIPIDRLRELAQADRLIGTTVYEPNKRGFISVYEIISVHISKCSVLVGRNLLDGVYSNVNGFEISALGKSVFLTREEAEAKLKEREKE